MSSAVTSLSYVAIRTVFAPDGTVTSIVASAVVLSSRTTSTTSTVEGTRPSMSIETSPLTPGVIS